MNRTQILILLAMLTGCSTVPHKSSLTESPSEGVQTKEVLPLFGSFNVNRYVLKNGLRLLVIEDHSSPTLAYQTWFRVGSRDETIGRTGLAHLFEHMMFKETKNLKDGEFDKLLEGAVPKGKMHLRAETIPPILKKFLRTNSISLPNSSLTEW